MKSALQGIGLGLRRDLVDELLPRRDRIPNFLELAPENWMGLGGRWSRILRQVAEVYPLSAHGLSLSLGSPDALDWDFLKRLRKFFRDVPVALYSEHLSYAKCDNAHLHELLPVPFRRDAVKHIAARIRETQDFLERRIAIENVSYYTPVAPEMSEAEFIRAVVEQADCDLLLDVNNVYVNGFNHGYDPKDFITALPLERVSIIHMAGHTRKAPDFIVDTHGEPIVDPVYDLFEFTLEHLPHSVPVLLERDYNFPDFQELHGELLRLKSINQRKWEKAYAA